MQWKIGRPERSGYYLAAWRRLGRAGDPVRVSELYFNPEAAHSWSCGRGYIGQDGYGIEDVIAWTDLPDPPASSN